MSTKDVHIQVHHSHLKRWPGNIRKTYRPDDVAEMADSQRERAERGQPACVHELVITPGPSVHYNGQKDLFLVAGHLRHAGNSHLGKRAPLLNCVVRYYATEADMMADMRTENGQRTDPTPLEWAQHFKGELDADVPMSKLIKQSRKTKFAIDGYLALLDLAPEAQKVIDAGDLPMGAVAHLKELDDKKAQGDIARRLRGGTINQVSRAVTLEMERHVKEARKGGLLPKKRPATDRIKTPAGMTLAPTAMRSAAAHQCSVCDIGKTLSIPEPAWHIAMQAAGVVCDDCTLNGIKGACAGCPLAEMMSHLARTHGVAEAGVAA